MVKMKKTLACTFFALAFVTACYAFSPDFPPTDKPHGAMEVFGVGPEMFADRGIAWVKAICAVLSEVVTSAGILALAIILLIKNIRNQELQARVDRVDERVQANTQEITKVALATEPQKPLQ